MPGNFFPAVSHARSTPSSADEIVDLYQRRRDATRRLMHQAMELLSKSDLEAAAKALGMWHRDIIVFESEDMSSVLMNYALLELRREGLTTVERFRADRSLYASDDVPLVEFICRPQFRLLTLRRPAGTGCWEAADGLTGKVGVLVDIGLSVTGKAGDVLATHVWDLVDDFWMATGAILPFSQAAEQLLTRRIRRICRCKLRDWPKLAPQQRSSVTALIIRCCLETGAADQMVYA